MPLARIITNSADDSLELSMQLRARGFRVETVSPDQIPETPVDLEVRMEECAPEEVLVRAAEVNESEDLWVFVAPGALDERTRPMRTVQLQPQEIDGPLRVSGARKESERPSAAVPISHSEDPAVPTFKRMPEPIFPGILAKAEVQALGTEIKRDVVENSPQREFVPEKVNGEPANVLPGKVKVVVLPKSPERAQIPEVPERVVPVIAIPQAGSADAAKRPLGPYKIAFRTGPAFWKQAAVSIMLVLLAGVLAAVIGLRPSLPSAGKRTTPAVPVPAAARAVQSPARVEAPVVPDAGSKHEEKKASVSASAPAPAAAPVKKAAPASSAPVTASLPAARPASQAQAAAKAQHPPGWLSDRDIIADDTVVFYDHKTGKAMRKTKGNSAVKQRANAD